MYDAAQRQREKEREREQRREKDNRETRVGCQFPRARETRRKKGAGVYGYVRTAAIGGRISRRCYPQTRGFDQFIPRDEANVGPGPGCEATLSSGMNSARSPCAVQPPPPLSQTTTSTRPSRATSPPFQPFHPLLPSSSFLPSFLSFLPTFLLRLFHRR